MSISPEAVEEGDEVLVDAPELLAAIVEAEGELGVGGAVEVAQAERPLLAEVGELLLQEVPRLRARLGEQLAQGDLVLEVLREGPEIAKFLFIRGTSNEETNSYQQADFCLGRLNCVRCALSPIFIGSPFQ